MPSSSPPEKKDLAGYSFIPKTPTDEERESLLDIAQNAWGIAEQKIAGLVGYFLIQPTFHIYTDKGIEDHTLDWETQEKKLSEMERMRDCLEKLGKSAYFAALISHAQLPAESAGSMFAAAAPANDTVDGLRVQVESSAGHLVVCTAPYHWPAGMPAYLDAAKVVVHDAHMRTYGPLAGFYRRLSNTMSRH